MRRIVSTGFPIFFPCLLAACLPVTTSSPLGTTAVPQADRALTGMWKGRFSDSEPAAYATFYRQSDGTMKIVLLTPPNEKDDGGWMILPARTIRLGSQKYLDIDARQIEGEGKPADPKLAHVPVLYRISGDGFLVLYLIDESTARKAVHSGKIAGTIEPGKFGDVTITAAPAKLDAFFASNAGRSLFTKRLGILSRVK
jgi:hypothetical protein